MKKSKILFPLTIENINPKSYFFAINLARKLNYELVILATNERKKETDICINQHKNLHQQEGLLCLLKLNGIYHGAYNQWNSFEDLSMKVISNSGEFNTAIYNYIQKNKVDMVLFDYNTFFDKVYSSRLLEYLSCNTKKLRVMPQENEGFEMEPKLLTELLNSSKNDAFKGVFFNTKLYNLPEQ